MKEEFLVRASAIDDLLKKLFLEHQAGVRVALVCQGGYGRRELCLHSDIDLLFLYEGDAAPLKKLQENLLPVLWDSGLKVGFATRTISDCQGLMQEDLTVLSSLIDVRYLAGDRVLFEGLKDMLTGYFSSPTNREKLFQQKIEENVVRHEKYGDSISLLEPNLKEGRGGLRDFHTLFWFSKITSQFLGHEEPPDLLASLRHLTDQERQDLGRALRFLWTIRNELHRLSGRRLDQIVLEYQEAVAASLGFKPTPGFLGVELFMQKYYGEAATIQKITDKAIKRIVEKDGGRPRGDTPTSESTLSEEDPLYLLKIFDQARQRNVELDDFTREKIEQMALGINDAFRSDPAAGALFRDILGRTQGLGKLLREMNDLGVLGAFLPEFAKLRFRVQHDIYHVYTVDVHSIFAVGELDKLIQGDYRTRHPILSQVVADVKKKDLLAFAILYHDIGKGEGKGHVEKGAPLIRKAGIRLGFSPRDVDVLEFLERSHLIMTHVAFRRDLEEQSLILQFAKAMQSQELLDMLYILTFCDTKAVGPEAMTDWKATLIEYLYLKTREVFSQGPGAKEDTASLLQKIRGEVSAPEFLDMMPPKYLLATPPALIRRHVLLWERLVLDNETDGPASFVSETRLLEKEGMNEVTLLAETRPGFFSRMAGLFAAHNINIIESQRTPSSKGHDLLVFKVTEGVGGPIHDERRWKSLFGDLKEILDGRLQVENLVAENFSPPLFKKKVAQVVPSRMDVDNDVSGYYTVIDVYTEDRVGLLYQITSTLESLGLSVDVSKVSTKVDQVADTFYVKDVSGRKLTPEQIAAVREAVGRVL